MNTKELTIKQRKFVAEYLKDGNATRAYSVVYKVVGMSASVSGSKLLKNAKVADEIAAQRSILSKTVEKEHNVTVETIVAELAKGAFAEIDLTTLKFSDKVKCLELLAKTLGMLDGKSEPPKDHEAIQRRLQDAVDQAFKD